MWLEVAGRSWLKYGCWSSWRNRYCTTEVPVAQVLQLEDVAPTLVALVAVRLEMLFGMLITQMLAALAILQP